MTDQLIGNHTFFESHADDVAAILRGFGAKWGAREQVDNEDDDTLQKRCFIGYAYADGDERAHLTATFWYGAAGTVIEAREGMLLRLELAPTDYQCAQIKVNFVPDEGEDYLIEGDSSLAHFPQELKDRLTIMWHADTWGLQSSYIEENAATHRKFAGMEAYYKQQLRPLGSVLQKMGAAWGGEEQTDNQPDPETSANNGLFVRGRGKKRYFVGYSAPTLRPNQDGKLTITRAALWLDTWQGDKGTVKKSSSSRHVSLSDPKTLKRINITFSTDAPMMSIEGVNGTSAKTAKEMATLLQKLWQQDAFGLRA